MKLRATATRRRPRARTHAPFTPLLWRSVLGQAGPEPTGTGGVVPTAPTCEHPSSRCTVWPGDSTAARPATRDTSPAGLAKTTAAERT